MTETKTIIFKIQLISICCFMKQLHQLQQYQKVIIILGNLLCNTFPTDNLSKILIPAKSECNKQH